MTIREFNVVVDGGMSGMVGRFMERGGGKYQYVWFEPGEVVAIASGTWRHGVVEEREREILPFIRIVSRVLKWGH